VARQNPAQIAANPQAAMMNKMMVYLFPLGVVAGGPFFPLAILLYWLSNNLWTLAQQRVVYQWIDAEDEEKKQAALATRQSLAPRPGQKPSRPKKEATASPANLTDSDRSDGEIGPSAAASGTRSPGSGAKDAGRRPVGRRPADGSAEDGSDDGSADGVSTSGSVTGGSAGDAPADGAPARSTNGQGSGRADRPAPPGRIQQRPGPRKKTNRKRR
jgi:YidC/Oxa1 family membrane protein insertase